MLFRFEQILHLNLKEKGLNTAPEKRIHSILAFRLHCNHHKSLRTEKIVSGRIGLTIKKTTKVCSEVKSKPPLILPFGEDYQCPPKSKKPPALVIKPKA